MERKEGVGREGRERREEGGVEGGGREVEEREVYGEKGGSR